MAGYTLQTSRAPFKSGKNILASEHVQFIEGGATLDAAKVGKQYLEVGTPIARNLTTGKFEVFTTATGYDEFHLLNVDVDVNGVDDVVIGEVIIRGSVYDAKLPATATAEFKQLAAEGGRIRFVKHI